MVRGGDGKVIWGMWYRSISQLAKNILLGFARISHSIHVCYIHYCILLKLDGMGKGFKVVFLKIFCCRDEPHQIPGGIKDGAWTTGWC